MNTPVVCCAAYQGKEPYIFVSYSHKDSEIIYQIINQLNGIGYRIWYDEGIEPGNEWPEELANAICDCSYFMVFITKHSIHSKYVADEINYSLNQKKPFLAIYIEDTQLPRGLDLRMSSIQAIPKYRMDDAIFYKKLIASLTSKGVIRSENITKESGKDKGLDRVQQNKGKDYIQTQDRTSSSANKALNSTLYYVTDDTMDDFSDENILDVTLEISIELGCAYMLIEEIKAIKMGDIVMTKTKAGAPLEVLINDKVCALGEVVVMEEAFGVRLTEIIQAEKASQYNNQASVFSKNNLTQMEALKNDLSLRVTVELGKRAMMIKEIMGFAVGTVIELERHVGEPVSLYVNGEVIALGEVVVDEEYFGIRITNVFA